MKSKNVCPHCQAENTGEAKFCTSCGSELKTIAKHSSGQFSACKKCGTQNSESAHFCSGCGASLRGTEADIVTRNPLKKIRKTKPKQKQQKKKLSQSWYLFGILAAVAFIYIIYQNSDSTRRVDRQPQYYEPISTDSAIERQVMEIAANFVCPCGACGELPLDTCTCDAAVQERQFIRSHLQQGKTKEEVIEHVKASFDGYRPGTTTLDLNNFKLNDPLLPLKTESREQVNEPGNYAIRIANATDRMEIFSHFFCPCGQCDIPELRDCNCNHQNGATEVKGFVDQKIAEGKYTTAQIIDLVDNQYGHKIR